MKPQFPSASPGGGTAGVWPSWRPSQCTEFPSTEEPSPAQRQAGPSPPVHGVGPPWLWATWHMQGTSGSTGGPKTRAESARTFSGWELISDSGPCCGHTDSGHRLVPRCARLVIQTLLGMRVNCVWPGPLPTDLQGTDLERAQAASWQSCVHGACVPSAFPVPQQPALSTVP